MKIIIGTTGGIAAYKVATLTRLLVKAGHQVQVVMTPEATAFVTPLTLSTLSKRPVLIEFFDANTGLWNNHVELGLWADLLVIAPATANFMAEMAGGICRNLLHAVWLSMRGRTLVCPAMDHDMYLHPATQRNMQTLKEWGVDMLPPAEGELASGLTGQGRLQEPEDIFLYIQNAPAATPLTGKKVLLSAGPTYEAIDPVRYITNHSTGKMGAALAHAFVKMGAEVVLVHGPLLPTLKLDARIKAIPVTTAKQMHDACMQHWPQADLALMTAAVADYAPTETADKKIKKQDGEMTLRLSKTTDILAAMGQSKQPGQVLGGFSLETHDETGYAQQKLHTKNCDFVVMNSLNDIGAGFAHDTNKVTIMDRKGQQQPLPLMDKTQVAEHIAAYIAQQFYTT